NQARIARAPRPRNGDDCGGAQRRFRRPGREARCASRLRMNHELLFEEEAPELGGDRLTLRLDSWEGPLDLLLALARGQKVDLREISILALVEQYLEFLNEAKALKLEIAADYLVMAAWLAYLKSCLLLPRDMEADPSPEELA